MSSPTELEAALDIALEAGRVLEKYFGRSIGVTPKAPGSLVSEADREAEDLIMDRLRKAFPDDGLVGEESGTLQGRSGRTWYVDPLDGTTNFLKGSHRWAVSLGLYASDGTGLLGVVHAPAMGETFTAVAGRGSRLNGRPISCSSVGTLQEALVGSGFPYDPSEESNLGPWSRMLHSALSVRCLGAAALDLCDVALGRLDAYWEYGLGVWDTAAGMVIAREAGARVSSIHRGASSGPAVDVIAANPNLYEQVRAVVVGT